VRTITIDHNYCRPRGYRSASEAIAAEAETSRAKLADIDSPRIAGQYVVGFAGSDQAVSVTLSDAFSLELLVVERRVEWRVERAEPAEASRDAQDYPPLCLFWPDGKRTIMDGGELLKTRLSFPLRMLFAGQSFVNVYFKGGGCLRFHPFWNRSDEAPLLHVSELEPVGYGATQERP
jgi:hypothetical protein